MSTNQKVGGLSPGSSRLHVEMSLGKTLNPHLPPVRMCVCEWFVSVRNSAKRFEPYILFSRWLVIAVGLVRAYLARGSYHGLYYSIEKPLKFFQTGAILEVR